MSLQLPSEQLSQSMAHPQHLWQPLGFNLSTNSQVKQLQENRKVLVPAAGPEQSCGAGKRGRSMRKPRPRKVCRTIP